MIVSFDQVKKLVFEGSGVREASQRQSISFELDQRKWLLLGVDCLAALPFALFWIMGALSFARCPKTRFWGLGGAAFMLCIFASLEMTLAWALGDEGGIMAGDFKSFQHCGLFLHLGLALGCRVASTSPARRLRMWRPSENDSFCPETATTVPNEAEDEESKLPDKSPTKDSSSVQPEKPAPTQMILITMIWLATSTARTFILSDVPLIRIADEGFTGFDKFNLTMSIISISCLLALYFSFWYYYVRRTSNLGRELLVGMLVAASSFATLRLTATIDTWAAWTIDGLLGMIGLNIGLVAGFYSGVRT